jgi:hypothetical protein
MMCYSFDNRMRAIPEDTHRLAEQLLTTNAEYWNVDEEAPRFRMAYMKLESELLLLLIREEASETERQIIEEELRTLIQEDPNDPHWNERIALIKRGEFPEPEIQLVPDGVEYLYHVEEILNYCEEHGCDLNIDQA